MVEYSVKVVAIVPVIEEANLSSYLPVHGVVLKSAGATVSVWEMSGGG